MINHHEQWWICLKYHEVSLNHILLMQQNINNDKETLQNDGATRSKAVLGVKPARGRQMKTTKKSMYSWVAPQCHQRPNLFRFSHRSWHLHPRWAQRWNPNRTKTSLRIQDSFRRLTPAFSVKVKLLKIKWPFWSYMKACDSHTCLESRKSHIRSTRICRSPLPKPSKKWVWFGMICEKQPSFCYLK